MKLNNIKSIKIGKLKYKIYLNKYIDDDLWGQIYFSKLQIRLKRYQENKKIKTKVVLHTLLHEAIHAIDRNIKFTKNSNDHEDSELQEDNTDLFASYIIDNIEKLANKTLDFNHFKKYVDKCEIDINREEMTFEAIVQMLSDNNKLLDILMEVFKWRSNYVSDWNKTTYWK